MNGRSIALVGSLIRGAWGLGALAAPKSMRNAQLTGGRDLDRPDARLYVRGFGGHQVLLAGFTIAVLRSDELLRPALVLDVLLDGLDITSAVAEIPARGGLDRTLTSGIVFSGAGALTSLAALRAL